MNSVIFSVCCVRACGFVTPRRWWDDWGLKMRNRNSMMKVASCLFNSSMSSQLNEGADHLSVIIIYLFLNFSCEPMFTPRIGPVVSCQTLNIECKYYNDCQHFILSVLHRPLRCWMNPPAVVSVERDEAQHVFIWSTRGICDWSPTIRL